MRLLIPFLLLALAAVNAAGQNVDPSTLDGKVLLGYQGWFNCAGDGSPRNDWRSWARGAPAPDTLTIDMYPDLKEFDPSELCAVPGFTIGGRPAYLFSAWNPKVVSRHFQWMKHYGLDGVLVQRFITNIAFKRSSGDVVLKNVMAAAKEHGRAFAIEYDVTGFDPQKFFEVMREDWKYLVDELKVASHPNYLRHAGKPLLSVWGMGLEDLRHPPREPGAAKNVVQWFRIEAPRQYRVAYMGGVPSRWRTLSADAQKDAGWTEVYAMMDVVQPWTVGRYRDEAGADKWKDDYIAPDLARTRENKQLYMPVVFPGFSWANLKKDAKPNQIPRNGGRFFWRQAVNAKQAGASMLKIAMFDEVNEATAVFKIAAGRQDAPEQGFWLTLDADGESLPSDWYLRLSGEITRIFHGQRPAGPALPAKPGSLGSPNKVR
jgi:hypothetical protein